MNLEQINQELIDVNGSYLALEDNDDLASRINGFIELLSRTEQLGEAVNRIAPSLEPGMYEDLYNRYLTNVVRFSTSLADSYLEKVKQETEGFYAYSDHKFRKAALGYLEKSKSLIIDNNLQRELTCHIEMLLGKDSQQLFNHYISLDEDEADDADPSQQSMDKASVIIDHYSAAMDAVQSSEGEPSESMNNCLIRINTSLQELAVDIEHITGILQDNLPKSIKEFQLLYTKKIIDNVSNRGLANFLETSQFYYDKICYYFLLIIKLKGKGVAIPAIFDDDYLGKPFEIVGYIRGLLDKNKKGREILKKYEAILTQYEQKLQSAKDSIAAPLPQPFLENYQIWQNSIKRRIVELEKMVNLGISGAEILLGAYQKFYNQLVVFVFLLLVDSYCMDKEKYAQLLFEHLETINEMPCEEDCVDIVDDFVLQLVYVESLFSSVAVEDGGSINEPDLSGCLNRLVAYIDPSKESQKKYMHLMSCRLLESIHSHLAQKGLSHGKNPKNEMTSESLLGWCDLIEAHLPGCGDAHDQPLSQEEVLFISGMTKGCIELTHFCQKDRLLLTLEDSGLLAQEIQQAKMLLDSFPPHKVYQLFNQRAESDLLFSQLISFMKLFVKLCQTLGKEIKDFNGDQCSAESMANFYMLYETTLKISIRIINAGFVGGKNKKKSLKKKIHSYLEAIPDPNAGASSHSAPPAPPISWFFGFSDESLRTKLWKDVCFHLDSFYGVLYEIELFDQQHPDLSHLEKSIAVFDYLHPAYENAHSAIEWIFDKYSLEHGAKNHEDWYNFLNQVDFRLWEITEACKGVCDCFGLKYHEVEEADLAQAVVSASMNNSL